MSDPCLGDISKETFEKNEKALFDILEKQNY